MIMGVALEKGGGCGRPRAASVENNMGEAAETVRARVRGLGRLWIYVSQRRGA